MAAVALEFLTVPHVGSANVSLMIGDGGYIWVDTITSTYADLVYSHGWGDCPSGCMYRRNWSFRVGHDCTVDFIGSTGHPAPPPVNVTTTIKKGISLYPNPVSEMLHVDNIGTASYAIYNLRGQVLQSGTTTGDIGVSPLLNGVYFIRLHTKDISITHQFIKQ
jgi:hypothetical protein